MKSKWIVLTAAAVFIFSCSQDEPVDNRYNRFLASLSPASEIGEVSVLTDEGRAIYPTFAPGDSVIYFQRLLIDQPSDTTGRNIEELVKPYGIGIKNRQLYTLSEDYAYPEKEMPDIDSLGTDIGEKIAWAAKSPDGSTIVYETTTGNTKQSHMVYLSRGDSTVQLTYGDTPCFIDRFSNTGKYLTVIYGYGPSWIIIFDMDSGKGYRIERAGDYLDYMTEFSSDDKMMAFIRSQKKISVGYDFMGDICLFTFKR